MSDSKNGDDSSRDNAAEDGAVGGVASSANAAFAADPLAAVSAGEAFAVVPLEWCPHLEFPNALNPLPSDDPVDVREVVTFNFIFSRVLRDPTPHLVGPLVTLNFFGVFAVFGLAAAAQM